MANERGPIVWINGEFVPERRALVSPFDRGFLYGDGLFETIRAEEGELLFLAEHLERLRESLAALRIDADLERDWRALAREVLTRNGLAGQTAAVKLLVTRGAAAGLGLPRAEEPTALLYARPYHAPDYARGWRLHIVREGYSPPLSPHKTLNYLYCLCARQAALDAGADEGVILDAEGRAAETAAGSLLVKLDGRWARPESAYQLRGVTIAAAEALLAEQGAPVERRPVGADDLLRAATVWVLNSLMGVMAATEVEGRRVARPAFEEAAALRRRLFAAGRGK